MRIIILRLSANSSHVGLRLVKLRQSHGKLKLQVTTLRFGPRSQSDELLHAQRVSATVHGRISSGIAAILADQHTIQQLNRGTFRQDSVFHHLVELTNSQPLDGGTLSRDVWLQERDVHNESLVVSTTVV